MKIQNNNNNINSLIIVSKTNSDELKQKFEEFTSFLNEIFTGIKTQQDSSSCNVPSQCHEPGIPVNFTNGKYVEAIKISEGFRKIHTEPKGGKFYFQPGGGKKNISDRQTFQVPECYVHDFQPKVINSVQIQTNQVKCVKVSGEFRRIHVEIRKVKSSVNQKYQKIGLYSLYFFCFSIILLNQF